MVRQMKEEANKKIEPTVRMKLMYWAKNWSLLLVTTVCDRGNDDFAGFFFCFVVFSFCRGKTTERIGKKGHSSSNNSSCHTDFSWIHTIQSLHIIARENSKSGEINMMRIWAVAREHGSTFARWYAILRHTHTHTKWTPTSYNNNNNNEISNLSCAIRCSIHKRPNIYVLRIYAFN